MCAVSVRVRVREETSDRAQWLYLVNLIEKLVSVCVCEWVRVCVSPDTQTELQFQIGFGDLCYETGRATSHPDQMHAYCDICSLFLLYYYPNTLIHHLTKRTEKTKTLNWISDSSVGRCVFVCCVHVQVHLCCVTIRYSLARLTSRPNRLLLARSRAIFRFLFFWFVCLFVISNSHRVFFFFICSRFHYFFFVRCVFSVADVEKRWT